MEKLAIRNQKNLAIKTRPTVYCVESYYQASMGRSQFSCQLPNIKKVLVDMVEKEDIIIAG